MKVVFITPVTPYKENMRGPSGHPYHLMVERPAGIDIVIYSFNQNHLPADTIDAVEQELGVEIRLLSNPKWISWILKFHLTFVRLFLNYPIQYYVRLGKKTLDEINALHPDLVWLYCQEFSGLAHQLKDYPRLHTLPDCYSLHFYRRLALRSSVKNMTEYLRVLLMYRKHYRMESHYSTDENVVYHLVGEEDAHFLHSIQPGINAHFIRHPHYEVSTNDNAKRFHQSKIRLLFAGRYDLYSQQAADEVLQLMCANGKGSVNKLKEHYFVTFLGKGWEKHVEVLKGAGYEVNHIRFAPDYIEEIRKHDIQMQPLSVGTGTKGKVLDALANGLLVIGTPYALENIAVKHGESCVEYRNPQEAVNVLLDIPNNIRKYETMAKDGQQQVLIHHNRARISDQLFNLLKV